MYPSTALAQAILEQRIRRYRPSPHQRQEIR